MADTKPFASLSSGLLARKGGAKPAMRPQSFGSFGGNLEDLGWNDMGAHVSYQDHVPTPIDALTPSPGGRPHVVPADPASEPPVLEQQREIEARLSEPRTETKAKRPARLEKAEVVALPRSRTAKGKAKAAFTLRLDPDRHLKLRLASALTRRSSQQLVTEALDNFLNSLPDVEALADRVPAAAGQRSR